MCASTVSYVYKVRELKVNCELGGAIGLRCAQLPFCESKLFDSTGTPAQIATSMNGQRNLNV